MHKCDTVFVFGSRDGAAVSRSGVSRALIIANRRSAVILPPVGVGNEGRMIAIVVPAPVIGKRC